MVTLIEKRFEAQRGRTYGIKSSHPRTLALAIPGFLVLMGMGIGCFIAMAILQRHELLFALGFITSIAAAIGWMFFSLSYGRRHFEKNAPPPTTARGDSGITKGKQI